MQSYQDDSRVGRVLEKLGRTKRSGAGYVARCPAHDDREASLSISVGDDGKVLLHCFAGCSFDAIRAALDMAPGELFADNTNGRSNGASHGPEKEERTTSLTLAEFAAHKKLPAEALAFYGVHDAIRFGRPCVEFDYRRRDGTQARTRQRIGLSGKRFTWKGDGGEIVAYEPDQGALARAQRYVVVVEGESDTLTLLYAGFPALGVPGADATRVLRPEHFEGLSRVFVVHEGGQGGDTFATKVPELVKSFGFSGDVHVLKMPGGAKDPSGLFVRDPGAFPDAFQRLLRDAVTPPHRFDALWKTVAERGSLTTRPAPRRWLLQRPDDETCGMANPVGILPLGKAGLLIAQGGVGKTMALVQLAVSVATGRRWFDHYLVATTGRVLLALAEEDEEEVDRRLYEAGIAMRLTDAQRAQVGERVVALGLSGYVTALVAQDGQQSVETDVLSFFRRKLAEGNWTLVVLDTLSRFAGGDTEKDNAQATRFIQTIESLCRAPGSPTVLIAHHTNKTSRTDGSKTSSSHARGATALTDNTRWTANLERVGEGVKFEITKSNYAPDAPAIMLSRDKDSGGYLRIEAPEAARARADETCREELERRAAIRARIVEVLAQHLDITNQGDLAVRCGISKKAVGDALHDLFESGAVSKVGGVFRLGKQGGDAPNG